MLDAISNASFMVNRLAEIVWCNGAGHAKLFGENSPLPDTAEERNLVGLLLWKSINEPWWKEVLQEILARIHMSQEQYRIIASVLEISGKVPQKNDLIIDDKKPFHGMRGLSNADSICLVEFREGVLVIYREKGGSLEKFNAQMAKINGNRLQFVRELLIKRLPVYTKLVVFSADLQDSMKICKELLPQEYFRLIGSFVEKTKPIFRQYAGTFGKHVGDGFFYYFFPQVGTNYIFNAIQCSIEVQKVATEMNDEWKKQSGLERDIKLNVGLQEGQAWVGAFKNLVESDLMVLGDAVNECSRIAELARDGEILCSKSVITSLPAKLCKTVVHGIHHTNDGLGRDFLRASEYALKQVQRNQKLNDIGTLPVTRIHGVMSHE